MRYRVSINKVGNVLSELDERVLRPEDLVLDELHFKVDEKFSPSKYQLFREIKSDLAKK